MIFKPSPNPQIPFSDKTNADYIELSELANNDNQAHCGVKGTSVFSTILGNEYIKKVPFDAMHLVFEGHTKFILKHLVPKYHIVGIK